MSGFKSGVDVFSKTWMIEWFTITTALLLMGLVIHVAVLTQRQWGAEPVLLVFQFGKSSLIQYLQRKALGILGNAASGKVHKIRLWYPAAQIFFFIKSIVDLLCSFNFCFTEKWPSYTYMYIPFFHTIFHHVLTQDIGHRSLCCTEGPHCLSIPAPNSLSFPLPSPSPLATTILLSISMIYFSFVDRIICAIF